MMQDFKDFFKDYRNVAIITVVFCIGMVLGSILYVIIGDMTIRSYHEKKKQDFLREKYGFSIIEPYIGCKEWRSYSICLRKEEYSCYDQKRSNGQTQSRVEGSSYSYQDEISQNFV